MATSGQAYASLASQYDPSSMMYKMLMGFANNPAAAETPNNQDMLSSALSIPAMPSVVGQDANGNTMVVPYNAAPPAGVTNLSYTASGSPGYAASAPAGSAIQAATPVANPAASWQPPAPTPAPTPTSLSGSGASPNPAAGGIVANPANRLRRPGGSTLGRGTLGINTAQLPAGSGGGDQQQTGGGMTSVGGPGGPIGPGGYGYPGADQPYNPPPLTPGGNGTGYSPISINNPYATPLQTDFPGAVQSPGGTGYNIPMGPVGAGANPVFQNWNTTPGGNGQGYTQGDPGYMASAEANRAIDYGNNFEQQYGSQYQQALAQQNAYQGAADASYSQLSQQPGYTADEASAIQADPYAVGGVVNSTQAAMNAAIDPSKLGMSDAQVQALKDQAASQVGLQYGGAMDDLQRQAEASGNVNPLALSAARTRLLQAQGVGTADALTNADIAATGAQRQANTNIANMRLGAATTIGGMGLNAGEYADTAASNRGANIAQQRIQGQQAARNYWQSQGQFQGGQANQATQARLSGAQTSLSGMGQGGSLAMQTEAERKANAARLGINVGPGGVSVGGNVGL